MIMNMDLGIGDLSSNSGSTTASCMTLGKSFNASVSCLPYLHLLVIKIFTLIVIMFKVTHI